MASVINGIPSPPSQSDPPTDSNALSAKRKRDDSNESHNYINGFGHSNGAESPVSSSNNAQALIRDLIDVLKGFDVVPSILACFLPDRATSLEPHAKRQKPADVSETQNTILTRASSNLYQSLDDVLADIDIAVADVMEKLHLPSGAGRNQYIPVTATQSEMALRISAFKKRAHELVRREMASEEQKANGINKKSYATNGDAGTNPLVQIDAGSGNNKTVLTLYGNAPGPKQLFSSFQLPTTISGENEDAIQPFREAGLPPGISTTQIVPVQSSNLVEESKIRTLGEVFPSPAHLQLHPPKPPSGTTTRSSTVGWYQPTVVDPFPRVATYPKAQISCGQWLDYSNSSSPRGSKKRQRDRAMSLTGAKIPVPEAEPSESEASKLDALFRSAYAGFAPIKDDSGAIAPTGQLQRLWWQQSGSKNFDRLVENATNFDLATTAEPELKPVIIDDEELKKFEELAENWENNIVDPSLTSVDADAEKSFHEKDVDQVLEDISELLETLYSYQRIRHMSLNPTSRAALLSTPDTSTLGTPTKPSDSEQATYEIIKSQITLLIATLPPYAVAKLNPDRLADLRISTKIEIHVDDYRGVLEEDESAAKARATATASSAASARVVAPPQPHRNSPAALYGNQYAAPRPSPVVSQQYYGATQTPSRPQASNLQRAPSSVQVPYPTQRAPAPTTPYRPQGYGTPNYGATARPVQQYQPSSQQQYMQTPAAQSYMRPASQNYQSVPQSAPQASMNGRGYPSQPTYPHQSQPAQNGHDYRYASNPNMGRQNSPQRPVYTPQQNLAQPRPNFSTPAPALPQQRYLQAPMMNGSPQVVQTPYSSHTVTYSTFLTHEQQANIVERQRVQLQQQQARAAAQTALGTPQASVNGTNPLAAGL